MKKHVINYLTKKLFVLVKNFLNLAGESETIQFESINRMNIHEPSIGYKIILLFFETHLIFLIRLILLLFTEKKKNYDKLYEAEKMQQINLYILTNLDRNIQETELAEHLGMSTGHFCRFFKRINGCYFTEYLNNYRISIASQMLTDSDSSVVDIGNSCGFNTNNYFIRLFKKRKGNTPGAYRLALSAKENNNEN